jgi:hypothetical protein
VSENAASGEVACRDNDSDVLPSDSFIAKDPEGIECLVKTVAYAGQFPRPPNDCVQPVLDTEVLDLRSAVRVIKPVGTKGSSDLVVYIVHEIPQSYYCPDYIAVKKNELQHPTTIGCRGYLFFIQLFSII